MISCNSFYAPGRDASTKKGGGTGWGDEAADAAAGKTSNIEHRTLNAEASPDACCRSVFGVQCLMFDVPWGSWGGGKRTSSPRPSPPSDGGEGVNIATPKSWDTLGVSRPAFHFVVLPSPNISARILRFEATHAQKILFTAGKGSSQRLRRVAQTGSGGASKSPRGEPGSATGQALCLRRHDRSVA